MSNLLERVSIDSVINMRCSLGYTKSYNTLILAAQKREEIGKVEIVVDV